MRGAPFIFCLLWSLPVAASDLPPLTKTDPGHRDPARMTPLTPWPRAEAHLTDPPQTTYLVVKDTPLSKFGTLDPVLSSACALGRFSPTRSLFRILLTGKTGQALLDAVPLHRRDLLSDPDKHARPGEIYYFRNPVSPNCEVRYDGPEPPRQLGSRGTAAPVPDRAALAQKARETWGKT